MKILSADKSELMNVSALEIRDNTLVVRCKVFGSMPMSAVLTPEEARKGLKLLNLRTIWFLLTLLFRSSRQAPCKA